MYLVMITIHRMEQEYVIISTLLIWHLVILKALEKIEKETGVKIDNLGTGNGYSVLDLVENFKRVNQIDVPYEIVERRPGDIAACYADP